MTKDGTCLRLALRSSNVTATVGFSSLDLSLEHPLNLPVGPWLPQRQYHVAVVVETSAATVSTFRFLSPLLNNIGLSELGGPVAALTLTDTESPVFLNCPAVTIVVKAAAGETSAQAFWTSPVAIDNLATDVAVTASARPGDFFSIVDSPHTVTYRASDGVQETLCQFQIDIVFESRSVTYLEPIFSPRTDRNFPMLMTDFIERKQLIVRQPLRPATTGLSPWVVLPLLDTSDFTELRLRLGSDDAYNRTTLRLRTLPHAVSAQIVVDLVWHRADATVDLNYIPPASADIGVRLEFGGYAIDQSPPLNTAEKTIILPAVSRLRTAQATIDPQRGIIAVRQGYSLPFRVGFNFTDVTLVLVVPSGRASVGGPAPTWRLTADSFFGVEYIFPYDADRKQDWVRYAGLCQAQDAPRDLSNCNTGLIEAPTQPGTNYGLPSWQFPGWSPGPLVFSYSAWPGTPFPLGLPTTPPTTVSITATSVNEIISTCSFPVRIVDREVPRLTLRSAPVLKLDANSARASVQLSNLVQLPVEDNSGFPVTVISPNVSTLQLPPGNNTVVIMARDLWNNSVARTTYVMVLDDVAPSVVCPNNIRVVSKQERSTVTWALPFASDNAGVPRVYTEPGSGARFGFGTHRVRGVAVDSSNNTAECYFSVTVAEDNTVKLAAGLATGLGLLFILFFVVLWRLRQARRRLWKPQDWNAFFSHMEQFRQQQAKGLAPVAPRELQRGHIQLLEELGKGAFGAVHKGILKESGTNVEYLVAVKVLHQDSTAVARSELLEEAAILAQFDHPHVVQLVGVVTAGQPIIMVVEYAEHGSLKVWLRTQPITLVQQLQWSSDTASGLAFIHSQGFLHRDVAARNVLLSSRLRAKVSDFGLARELEESSDYYRSRGGQLPVRWTAPEALESRKFSAATDCWAFGVLMYEVWTEGAQPYGEWNNMQVWANVVDGRILEAPVGCPPAVYNVMKQCWQKDPQQRPSLATLLQTLRGVHEMLCPGSVDRADSHREMEALVRPRAKRARHSKSNGTTSASPRGSTTRDMSISDTSDSDTPDTSGPGTGPSPARPSMFQRLRGQKARSRSASRTSQDSDSMPHMSQGRDRLETLNGSSTPPPVAPRSQAAADTKEASTLVRDYEYSPATQVLESSLTEKPLSRIATVAPLYSDDYSGTSDAGIDSMRSAVTLVLDSWVDDDTSAADNAYEGDRVGPVVTLV